jgi:hypothetical protein
MVVDGNVGVVERCGREDDAFKPAIHGSFVAVKMDRPGEFTAQLTGGIVPAEQQDPGRPIV